MLIILVGMLVMFYLMAPIYTFDEPKPFFGDKLYNPYEKMDSTQWRQYNFQVQSKVWGGLTDGRKNSNELIDSVYRALNFDHVATSDYQKINYYGSQKSSFIPTYEHGFNVFKTHQVCIGAKKVLWIDLIFFQTLSMKQWIIDQLSRDCEIVVLAHPLLRNGYTLDEMKYLTNYRMMEVLNNLRISRDHWDTALSSGHLVWIMGNDDAHDVLHPNDVGRKFTMINSPTTNREDIIKNLKAGNDYGVDFYPKMDVPIVERIARIKNVPMMKQIDLVNDTLFVTVNQKATRIDFIGQNGILRKTVLDTNRSFYKIKPEDTYVRTELKFADGSTIYLNPVVRYSGSEPASNGKAQINKSATLWARIIYFLVILSVVYLIRRNKLNRTKQNA
jgi:hypothetical protein